MNYSQQLETLENKILADIKQKLSKSNIQSKFILEKALRIKLCNFDVSHNDYIIEATNDFLIGNSGLHYSYNNLSTEQLVELANELLK